MSEEIFAPKVSIIIPVYNGANFLRESIESALSQTYSNVEIIVVNDGSDDNGRTEEVAHAYGGRIHYFKKSNGGVSSALNYGIRNMTGDYFSWLSHDDAYAPTKIADAVSLLRNTPGGTSRTIAYTSGYFIDKDGSRLKPFGTMPDTAKRHSGRDMAVYSCKYDTLNGCCMLIPREAFAEFGGFDESLRYSQDALMWLTLFFGGYGLVNDGKDNVMYRLHGGQTSRTRQDLFIRDSMVIAKKLAPDMVRCSNKGCNLLYHYAMRMAKHNCGDVACYYRSIADQHCPFTIVQRLHLLVQLLYGRFRGRLKSFYYRYILKVGA